MKNPSRIQTVIEAFQKRGWLACIKSPLADDPQLVHEVLYSINRGLKMIRFRAQGGGRQITWPRR